MKLSLIPSTINQIRWKTPAVPALEAEAGRSEVKGILSNIEIEAVLGHNETASKIQT